VLAGTVANTTADVLRELVSCLSVQPEMSTDELPGLKSSTNCWLGEVVCTWTSLITTPAAPEPTTDGVTEVVSLWLCHAVPSSQL
jgi:hypothetical protein